MTGIVRFSVREAIRNLRSSQLQSAIHAVLAASIGFGLVAFAASEAGAVVASWSAQEQAGRSSFLVTGKSTMVPASLCESANQIEGVRGAGSLISRSEADTALGVVRGIDVIRVTPGYIRAAWEVPPPSAALTAVAPPEFAHRFGLVAGSVVTYWRSGENIAFANRSSMTVTIDWAPTARARVDGVNDALIVATPPAGAVKECLVTAAPDTRSSVRRVLGSWFGPGYSVRPFLAPSALVMDPDARFSQRTAQWVCLVAALLLVVMRGSAYYGRRADFALYRSLGMKSFGVRVMAVTEFTIDTLAPFQLGAFIGLWFALGSPREVVHAVGIDYGRAVLILVVGALLGAWIVGRSSAYDRLRGL